MASAARGGGRERTGDRARRDARLDPRIAAGSDLDHRVVAATVAAMEGDGRDVAQRRAGDLHGAARLHALLGAARAQAADGADLGSGYVGDAAAPSAGRLRSRRGRGAKRGKYERTRATPREGTTVSQDPFGLSSCFRPTGLADGLALEEQRYDQAIGRFAPRRPSFDGPRLVPPFSPATADAGGDSAGSDWRGSIRTPTAVATTDFQRWSQPGSICHTVSSAAFRAVAL
jgi:hypothetical protein